METALIKFKAYGFRRLPTPYDEAGKKMYTAILNVKDVPEELDEWRELNVRDPKENKTVPKDIRDSLINDPGSFFFKNRGLLIFADSVEFDNVSNLVKVEFADKQMHGLADGGHSFRVIRRHLDGLSPEELNDFDAFVKVEILEGYKTREEAVPVIEARNNSTPVAEQSFQELLGAYNVIKEQVGGKPYFDRIYYKQYEENSDGTAKDIDVKELLSYLVSFDISSFGSKEHPIKAYTSRAKVVEHFALDKNNPDKKERMDKLAPLLPKILELRDFIYELLPEAYNDGSGAFGLLKGVVKIKKNMKKEEMCFTGRTSMYRIPAGFIYPILSAFRVLVKDVGGVYVWKQDPVALFNDLKHELAVDIGEQAKRIQNPNQLGKDHGTWTICYKVVENEVLKRGL